MVNVILRQKAIDDLNHIWFYTFEEWSEKQADKYYLALEFACTQIGKTPELGKEYEGISNNLLGLRTGKHIIFYQVISEDRIEIVRILHERIDVKNKLNE